MSAPHARVDIPALKARHPLGAAVEAAGVQLRGRGRVRQGVCPFHAETEASFTVYADTERWHCFGCGLGGDVLDFIQRSEDLSLPEAIRRLEGGGWSRPKASSAPGKRRPAPASVRDPALLTAAMRFYAARLRCSPEAQQYLASRGLDLDAARRLGLGYAPGGGLHACLGAQGFDDGRIARSGLVTGRGERFAGMIVVPELAEGRVQWLAGRAVDPTAQPRFQAPPGPKPVLGLGRLGPALAWIVVTEGLFDWLVLAAWGLPACAALGTQGLDKTAAALIRTGCPRFLLAFDADHAGREAAGRLAGLLDPRRAAVAVLPEGIGDAAELGVQPGGRAVFLRALERAARAAR